jgi:hypothetical protein
MANHGHRAKKNLEASDYRNDFLNAHMFSLVVTLSFLTDSVAEGGRSCLDGRASPSGARTASTLS